MGALVLGAVAVAVVAAAAAVIDQRSRRIPNGVVAIGAAAIAVAAAAATLAGDGLGGVASDVVAGVLLGGAPLLFVTWLIVPQAIGGGDWKLLTVLGAAVGLLDPLAAPVIVVVACAVAVAIALVRRQRSVAFAPPLLVGYLAAGAIALVWRTAAPAASAELVAGVVGA